jgi:hypothetical protein
MSDQMMQPLRDITQHSQAHVLGGIRTLIQASEMTQNQALDSPGTGIGSSVTCSIYQAIRNTY